MRLCSNGANHDVFDDTHMREEVEVLEDHPDIFTDDINVGFGSVRSYPFTVICPLVTSSRRLRLRRKVDLPEPDGPIIQTTSPS